MSRRDEAPLVLVVDDSDDAREIAAELLEYSGFRTAQAATGHEALEKTLALQPDALLLDLWLPGIDGWEITRRLKRDHATSHIPIVVLTAHVAPEPIARAREAGCDAVLTKPCSPDQILEELQRALANRTLPLPQDLA